MFLFHGFTFLECNQESKCEFLMSFRAGAGVTGFRTGAGVKEVTPITSELYAIVDRGANAKSVTNTKSLTNS